MAFALKNKWLIESWEEYFVDPINMTLPLALSIIYVNITEAYIKAYEKKMGKKIVYYDSRLMLDDMFMRY
mgnify:FL=1